MPVLAATPVSTPGPSGIEVISPASTEVAVTLDVNLWWLIDPQDPSNNITLEVINDNLPITTTEVQAQHLVLGADYVTIIAGTIYGAVFTLECDFLSDAAWQAFDKLRQMQKTLLLQAPFNDQWYIRIGSDVTPVLLNAAGLYRQANFQVIEQARPT